MRLTPALFAAPLVALALAGALPAAASAQTPAPAAPIRAGTPTYRSDRPYSPDSQTAQGRTRFWSSR